MNQSDVVLNQLPEDQRLAYLNAMGITVWVPRDTPEVYASEAIVSDAAVPQADLSKTDASKTQGEQQPSRVMPELRAETETGTQTETVTPPEAPAEQTDPQRQVPEVETSHVPGAIASSGYLKMVSWRGGSDQTDGVLIICRHDKDQPAQSFARANSPSLFMQDYIKALIEYWVGADDAPAIQLAHLTEAGLGEGCEPIEAKLEKLKPRAILMLGDAAASHLLDAAQSVSQARGRVHTLFGDYKALVSYHPYDLIRDSKLKKNAQDDLQLFVKTLLTETPT